MRSGLARNLTHKMHQYKSDHHTFSIMRFMPFT